MSLFDIFDVAGSGMSAHSVRLNTVASNMANANNASSTAEGAYRAKQPVFAAIYDQMKQGQASVGVKVNGIVEKQTPPEMVYEPGNPVANEKGYVYYPNVNSIEEMANMLSASRAFQNNVQLMDTAKQLMFATLRLGE
jgi:flagellar basal-body rod protein FlgC